MRFLAQTSRTPKPCVPTISPDPGRLKLSRRNRAAAMAWAPNWEERLAWVAQNGLPVVFTEARVEGNGFFALYLRADEALLPRSNVSRGWGLHISLGYESDYPAGVAGVLREAINAAWAERYHVLDIEWFGKGGAAMVRGSDPVSQDLVIQVAHRCGHYGNGVHVKPRQLHVSL